MKVDVTVCTYQSEKYLDQCLTSIEKTVPVNKLIIVDHYSTDRTVEIAEKHNARIYFENVGLAYARQIAISHVDTPIFFFADSDVVLHERDWFPKAVSLFDEKGKVGAVGIWTPSRLPPWRQKYVDYWWKNVPAKRDYGFVNAYLILKKAIEGIKIPSHLDAYEHVYIKSYIEKRGWTTTVIPVSGMHYYDFPDDKAAWLGAGSRVYANDIGSLPNMLIKKILTAPLKAIPPALAYNDPSIIISNTQYWLRYLKGWLQHDKYIALKRR
jgi:glycosyltransferase involved in cell wall biosynthesis